MPPRRAPSLTQASPDGSRAGSPAGDEEEVSQFRFIYALSDHPQPGVFFDSVDELQQHVRHQIIPVLRH